MDFVYQRIQLYLFRIEYCKSYILYYLAYSAQLVFFISPLLANSACIPSALGAWLDRVVSSVAANGMDGYSFTGIPNAGDPAAVQAAALIVSKLSADESKLLVFEGNPLFVAEADRAKVDYFILDTEKTEDVGDVKLQILNATGYAAVPASKLLLAAEAGAPLKDEDRVEYAAVEEMSRRVIAYGPLCGLGAYNIGNDYYNADMNYKMIRQAIQTLNPSK